MYATLTNSIVNGVPCGYNVYFCCGYWRCDATRCLGSSRPAWSVQEKTTTAKQSWIGLSGSS